jgi:hypothetical protein
METDPFSKRSCYLVILDFWTMDKVQKPISSQCYRPSSEPFRIITNVSKQSVWENILNEKMNTASGGVTSGKVTICKNKEMGG